MSTEEPFAALAIDGGDRVVRRAIPDDVPALVRIEIAAGRMFHAVGLDTVASDVPDADDLRSATGEGHAWVLEVGGEVAGYVVAERLDGRAHVAQVSVDPVHAGHGHGRALIDVVDEWGRAQGFDAMTLTTFRDVPWNAPYYARLGFEILPDEALGPELARTVAREARIPGLDESPRCAMIRRTGTRGAGNDGTDRGPRG